MSNASQTQLSLRQIKTNDSKLKDAVFARIHKPKEPSKTLP